MKSGAQAEAGLKNPEGQRVWRLIQESGIKRRWVARGLGISYSYLNEVEYGRSPLTASMKTRFATYFGLPTEELFPSGE